MSDNNINNPDCTNIYSNTGGISHLTDITNIIMVDGNLSGTNSVNKGDFNVKDII